MHTVTVKVLRSFNKTSKGDLADVGEIIEVSATRADELKRLGLAEPVVGTKAAPAPENKQAPEPENKGVEAAVQTERQTQRTIAKTC